MKLMILFNIIYLLLINKVLSINFLSSHKVYINNEYYSIAKLNEPCVVDNSTLSLNKNISPIERGVGLNNCEIGLTCFEFKCVYPSKVGDLCLPFYFTTPIQVYDRSNCTNEFYCDDNFTCQKTKPLKSSCSSNAECISIETPTAICSNNKCIQSKDMNTSSSERYILIFVCMSILIYIYYKQYTLQEAQLNRLNEIELERGGMEENRRDPELETLPPYSPPSSAFLADDDDTRSHCSNAPTLRSPPSYHQFPTVNPQISSLYTFNSNNTTINTATNNNSNSVYPGIITHDSNLESESNPPINENRLSLDRTSQYSTRSSQLPSTPPPSYSQPTTPYHYNIEPIDNQNETEILMPPTIPSSNSTRILSANVTPPSIAHTNSLSRVINIGNPTQNRNSIISITEHTISSVQSRLNDQISVNNNRNSRLSLSSYLTANEQANNSNNDCNDQNDHGNSVINDFINGNNISNNNSNNNSNVINDNNTSPDNNS